MNKIEIAKKAFEAKGNEKLNEVFVCHDGECYTNEGSAVRHCRETETKYLGVVKKSEIDIVEAEIVKDEAIEAVTEAKAEEAVEAAEQETAPKANSKKK